MRKNKKEWKPTSKDWKEGRIQLIKDFPELKKKYKHIAIEAKKLGIN